MKTTRILLVATLAVLVTNNLSFGQQWNGAQNTTGDISRIGNIGIGMTNPPLDKLHVSGGGIKIGSSGSIGQNWWEFGLDDGTTGTGIDFHGGSKLTDFTARIYRIAGDNSEFQLVNHGTGPMNFYTNGVPRMAITGDGRVDIASSIRIGPSGAISANWWEFGLDDGATGTGIDFHGGSKLTDFTARIYRIAGDNSEFQLVNNGTGPMSFYTSGVSRMMITGGGNIGIGTPNPQSKLAVNGKITAKEIEVTLQGWPDNVFEENYELKPLKEVENYISKHKHLPDMPSESEALENGVNLGEMQAKLLQKIEELTLYVIALEKKNDKFEQEISELRELIKKDGN